MQVGDGETDVCIDTLALKGAPLAPLWDLLAVPGMSKVVHAASQDLEIFVRLGHGSITPMFDTQIAAALLGYGDQLGYAGLVEKMTGLKLDKSLTRTDWSRRPLNAAELAYAAADVRHLSEIHLRLREELIARDRLSWMEEDCARLADPERYRNPPEEAWRRLKGLPRLAPEDAAGCRGARGLARAGRAGAGSSTQMDHRRRALYRIAERRPRTPGELQALQVLPPKTLEKHGMVLLALVASSIGNTVPAAAQELPLTEPEKNRLKKLQDRLRGLAETLGLPGSVIAPRADLEALARYGHEAQVTVLQGWRREVAGEALLDL